MRVLPSADPSTAGILPCYSTTDNKHKFSVWGEMVAYKIMVGKLQERRSLRRNTLKTHNCRKVIQGGVQ
jgi:hypothetical protein